MNALLSSIGTLIVIFLFFFFYSWCIVWWWFWSINCYIINIFFSYPLEYSEIFRQGFTRVQEKKKLLFNSDYASVKGFCVYMYFHQAVLFL